MGDILSVVDQIGPDVVVIGMRPRNPVGKLVMGSTLTKLLRGVDCPLLSSRPPLPEPRFVRAVPDLQ